MSRSRGLLPALPASSSSVAVTPASPGQLGFPVHQRRQSPWRAGGLFLVPHGPVISRLKWRKANSTNSK